MKRIFVLLLLMLIGLVVGKFVLESRYEKELNQLVFVASSFASVAYKSVKIDFDGAIVISGIRVEPVGYSAVFSIDQIRIFSSDRMFLLKGSKTFANGEFPNLFRVDVGGFVYDPSFGLQLNPKRECRFIEEQIDYQSIGVSTARDNWTISVNFEDKSNSVFKMFVNSADMYTMDFQLKFDATQLNAVSMMQKKSLPIHEITINSIVDKVFADNLIEYCAEKLGVSEEGYVSQVVGSDEYMKQLGIRLSEAAKRVLQDYVKGEADLELVSRPSRTIKNVSSLTLYEPKDIVSMLNLSLSSNGEPVGEVIKTIAYRAKQSDDSQGDVPVTDDVLPIEDNKAEPIVEQVEQRAKSYQTVEIETVGQYVGAEVRVKRKGKPVLEGYFKSYTSSVLKIETISYGGVVVFPISVSDIEQVEVYKE